MGDGVKGYVLPLADDGLKDTKTGIRGWNFPLGTTGICPLGNGLFYISKNGQTNGRQYSDVYLYRWTGNPSVPFRNYFSE